MFKLIGGLSLAGVVSGQGPKCGDGEQLDAATQECVAVNCKSENACDAELECKPISITCIRAPCKQFHCVTPENKEGGKCGTGEEFDTISSKCVAVSCEAESACKEGGKCMSHEVQCVRAPCVQFHCMGSDMGDKDMDVVPTALMASRDDDGPITISKFAYYPGYTGNLTDVAVVGDGLSLNFSNGGVEIVGSLTGVDSRCTKMGDLANTCGVHIHEGATCKTAGGHYYNTKETMTDPWLTVVYQVEAEAPRDSSGGVASMPISTVVNNNATAADTVNKRVFVVHDFEGKRIACAPIRRMGNGTVKGEWPGPDGPDGPAIGEEGYSGAVSDFGSLVSLVMLSVAAIAL